MKPAKPALFLNPVFPAIGPICASTNLPAIPTAEALKTFLDQNGPSCPVERLWQCHDCGQWHAKNRAPDPAGASSGTGRGKKT